MADEVKTPPPIDDGKHRYPEIGKFNHLEAAIGQRGTGKSTWQCYRAFKLREESGGAYVIGHSLGARMPEQLPPELGGHKLPIVYHQTIKKLDEGLRRHPEKWHVLAPPKEPKDGSEPDTADDLLKYADRLSLALRKSAWKGANPFRFWNDTRKTLGLRSPPIIVLIDEGIAVESASTGGKSRGKDRWFLQFIYSLRHDHIALLYSVQEPSSRSWRVLEAATVISVFRVRHKWALGALEAAGATREETERIANLPPYKHVTLYGNELDLKHGAKVGEEIAKAEPQATETHRQEFTLTHHTNKTEIAP